MAVERIKMIKARKPARCGKPPLSWTTSIGCWAVIEKGETHYRSTLSRGGSEFPETIKICARCFEEGVRQDAAAEHVFEHAA